MEWLQENIWFVLAQVMGAVTICFEFVSYQIKNQRKYLLVTSCGSFFWTLMFVFMGLHTSMTVALAGIMAAGFGVVRGLTFWWIFGKNTRKRKIMGRVFLYICLGAIIPFAVLAIIELYLPQQMIIQSLVLATALLFIVGQYLPSKHYLRIFTLAYALMFLLAQTPLALITRENGVYVGYWNPMGVLIELAKISSVIVFYIRYVITQKLCEISGLKFEQLQK